MKFVPHIDECGRRRHAAVISFTIPYREILTVKIIVALLIISRTKWYRVDTGINVISMVAE